MRQDLTERSVVLEAYEVRRLMLDRLKRSQTEEHMFYEDCKEAIRAATAELAEYFSELIQRKVPNWNLADVEEFAKHSDVPVDALLKWQRCHGLLVASRSALARVSDEVARAESAMNDAGGLFGAKKGREDDYRAASVRLKSANGDRVAARKQLDSAISDATAIAEELLEVCVGQAAHLAQAIRYPVATVPREILVAAATQAGKLSERLRRTQGQLIAEMRHGLNTLDQLYGVSHEG